MTEQTLPVWRRWLRAFINWFDTGPLTAPAEGAPLPEIPDRVEWARILPFIGVHATCLGVIWVGWSPIAVTVAVVEVATAVVLAVNVALN